jgi:ATP-dependent DNA helicase DinG
VAIPDDIPEPGRPGFAEGVRDAVEKAIRISQGRSFVLFTSYALLRDVHEQLAPILAAQRLRCLRQGEENRHHLLKRFAEEISSTLFGTDSFWEGVDVPGSSLEQVIITRLPFKVPTEPVLEARCPGDYRCRRRPLYGVYRAPGRHPLQAGVRPPDSPSQ